MMAPPRTGKTGWLARIIMHYPGPVLSTTTKPDVYGLTSGIRARSGRPVEVFNPASIGGVPSTFRWSPIAGCTDRAVAIRRADGFANAVNLGKDSELFKNAARAYLRALFHAAALVDGDMRLVSLWALTASRGGAQPAEEILREHGAPDWAAELSQLRSKADKTAATNEIVMSQMLSFMLTPALAEAVLPRPGDDLDLADFLRKSGTLYMIADNGGREEAPLAALFAAMTSELHYTATLIGQASPGGRLDPPLLMALDEVTQICPVPLPFWLADSGGKGVQIIPVVHGEAQLRCPVGQGRRPGRHGYLRDQGVAARYHRPEDAEDGIRPVREGGLQAQRPRARVHARRDGSGDDQAATGAVRAGRPRRPVAVRCPPADGLA